MIRYFCFLIVFVVCVGVGFGIAYFCGEDRKDDSNKV